VTFDLTGLPPTPAERDAFLADGRPDAWRYRDYVIRAFNTDKPYDHFVVEQLAGDELARGRDPCAAAELLIASGFNRCGPVHLVAGNTDPEVNRQEVLTEMTTAVGFAFLGSTIACARCHNHKFDPISLADYYRLQAFFAAAQPRETDISTAEERAAYEREVRTLRTQLAPLQHQVAAIDGPVQRRLAAAKRTALEPNYREALATEPKKRTAEQRRLVADAEPLLKVTWDEIVRALPPAERRRRATLRERIHDLEARLPPPPAKAWTVGDERTVPATYVLKRGDVKNKLTRVEPAFPRVLCDGRETTGTRRLTRLDLARWLTRPHHPLTARVFVNRLWQHHFGVGLAATPNEFGTRADPPSHPELLDWLATEFVGHGWSVKHLHRLMVLSNTYRQASRVAADPLARRIDPDNRLLWRMNRQRLEGEALRDSILAVAGSLNRKVGGPMVRVPLEPEVYELIFTEGEPDGLWHATADRREYTRRSIYLFAKRNVRLPLLEAFDRPDALTSCPVRPVSTFAPQALILMNGPFLQEQTKVFAARLLREAGSHLDRQVERAYLLALARPPRPAERDMAREFLAGQADLLRKRLRSGRPVGVPPDLPPWTDPAAAAALADFCLALLNRNELLYVP
jgi:hypothetical protein